MKQLVIATHNRGKLDEFRAMLTSMPYEIIGLPETSCPEPEETGITFVENALLKARHAAAHTQCATLADDSGLCVDALDGKPGVYSARFAGKNASSEDNIKALLAALEGVPMNERTARFICVLCFMRHADDPDPIICRGVFEGFILTEPRGTDGFGYDPIFYCPKNQCSASEMPLELKNLSSHRGNALRRLLQVIEL